PLLLVDGVIATGAVRARNLERQFFLVEVCTIQLKTGHTNQNDASALATHPRSLGHRIGGLGRSSNNYPIHTLTTTERHSHCNRILPFPRVAGLRTEQASQLQLGLIKINGQHTATLSTQKLNRQQPDQPYSSYNKGLTQGRLR